MRRLLAIALICVASGCTEAALDAATPQAMLRQLASAHTDDQCVSFGMKWGDKDHDGALTRLEFINLTLIGFDSMENIYRRSVEDWERAQANHPSPGTARKLEEARARLASLQAHNQAERPKYEADASARFDRFDANHDGKIDRAELAEACSALAHEEEKP